MKRAILLTWDVEEYDTPADFGAAPFPDGGLARGVAIGKEWLEISARWKVPGTAFLTARIAEAAPELLRETQGRGHEIASHGWSHERGADLKLEASRRRLSEMTGSEVVGFRSPRLRPVPLAEVATAGYRYDASSNPAVVPGRYCRLSQPRKPHQTAGIWEVPASVLPLVRFPLFWASFHLLPLPIYLARKLGLRVGQIPALVSGTHTYKTSRVKLTLDTLRCLLDFLRIRFWSWTGQYRYS